jgi:hypothetical protein
VKSFISVTKRSNTFCVSRVILTVFLKVCFYLYAPLPSFSQSGPQLQAEYKDVACSGNGQIKATLSGAGNYTASDFFLYLLPDEESYLAKSDDGNFEGLEPGSYIIKVILEDSNGSTELSEEISLVSTFEPLSFAVLSYSMCQSDLGSLKIVVNSGAPSTYQIDGPVKRPAQESPVFEDLPEGSYSVMVIDECGDRLSQTVQIQTAEFVIDNQLREFKTELEACGEIAVGHYIQAVGSTIEYPLQMVFEVTYPDGTIQQHASMVPDGGSTEGYVYGKIPFFPGQVYSYNLTVIDNCGQEAYLQNNVVDKDLEIADDMLWGAGPCGKRRLSIRPLHFSPPFSITFTKYPEGFDPAVYNEKYPGPFTADNIYFGNNDLIIPVGQYELEVTDACGRTATASTYYPGRYK